MKLMTIRLPGIYKRQMKRLAAWGFLLLSAPILNAAQGSDWVHEKWQGVASKHYQPPLLSEVDKAADLFYRLFTLKADARVEAEIMTAFARLNLQLESVHHNAERLFLVYEKGRPLQGAGFYIIRPSGSPVMLQAPHAYSDLHSGHLALQWMLESDYSALAVNTVSRHYLIPDLHRKADMAHLHNTYFISISSAFARLYPDADVLQLHGFNAAKRPVTENVNLILSSGTRFYSTELKQQANCLKQLSVPGVHTYPDEINVLGGTTNSIGRYLRRMNFSGFRHIEMSLPLRRKLIKNREMRDLLHTCFSS